MSTVTVIIPTYNREEVLGREKQGVLVQMYIDFELLVVGDCSTEETETVARSYDGSRVRYLAHEINKVGSTARKTGVEAAEGKYVAFLDDNEWYSEKISRQVETLERLSNEWVAAYCGCEVIREEGNPIDYLPEFILKRFRQNADSPPEGGSELISRILARDLPLDGALTLVVRRDVAEKIGGFDLNFPRHQDWEFLIRLLKIGEITHIEGTLVTKYGTDRPASQKIERGKDALFDRFSEEISAAEASGCDITGVHQFDLALLYFSKGQFVEGAKRLPGSEIRLLGLVWTLFIGTQTRLVSRKKN